MKTLYRNKEKSKIADICSGLDDYFAIDPTIIRLIFLFGLFIGGGILVYLIGWFIIPVKE